MSAPNQGRQSPDPERQTGAQTGSVANNPNDQGVASSANQTKDDSENQLKNLSSNPKGPLEDKAAEAASKGVGNASGAQ
ncbi:hypothetical protein Q7P37_005177 [Cladosporium fusiforme]